MITWEYLLHSTRCTTCGEKLGQGERAVRLSIEGVKRQRFYCELGCGPAIIKASLPPSPQPAEEPPAEAPTAEAATETESAPPVPSAPVARRRRPVDPEPFDSVAAMAKRFARRPQSKERHA